MSRPPDTETIGELTAGFVCRLDRLDIRAARQVFADLMDRSLPLIHAARLDQDDVVLERFAVVRDGQDATPCRVRLDAIGDPTAWRRAIAPTGPGGRGDAGSMTITALGLRVRLEPGPPVFRLEQ